MKYNSRYNILFSAAPPVPWSNFFNIHNIWYEFNNSYSITKEELKAKKIKPAFIFNGKNYNSLIKYINKFNM